MRRGEVMVQPVVEQRDRLEVEVELRRPVRAL